MYFFKVKVLEPPNSTPVGLLMYKIGSYAERLKRFTIGNQLTLFPPEGGHKTEI
jgi:hypothetical protein